MKKQKPLSLHPDRLFPADPATREIARRLYETVRDLPIVSPHGHTDPTWFADNEPFADPSTLLIVPDHYVFRMLYSQGLPLKISAFLAAMGDPRNRTRGRSGTASRRTITCSAARRLASGSIMYSALCSRSTSG